MSQKYQKKLKMSKKQKEVIAESLANFFYEYFKKSINKKKHDIKEYKQGSVRVPHKA